MLKTVCKDHCLEHFWTVSPKKCDVCKLQTVKDNYEKAYNILMDNFDYIPEDLRIEVSKKLDEVGL
jgi:hypothetical protein